MELKDFLPVWNKLEENQRRILSESAFERKYLKGDILHNGNYECQGLFCVRSGQIRAFIVSSEGREITLYRLFERDICLFSASCILNSIQFSVIISAEKDSEITVIPSDVYKEIMKTSAPLANYTNEILASRFSEVMWLIDQIMWKSFDKRLAAFLKEESVIENSLSLRITHETIGNHLGSPREVVTRMLKYFASEGIVKLSRGVINIIDPPALDSFLS
jgi:CRP/FNR family transcriptional regulator